MAERVWSVKDLVRRAKRRLAVLRHAEEVSGSVAATCHYYGISRTVLYRWKRRWEEGLDGLKDRSSAPLPCPAMTRPEVVEKIIHLRQHYRFGPLKIEMYLRRWSWAIGVPTSIRAEETAGGRLPRSSQQ